MIINVDELERRALRKSRLTKTAASIINESARAPLDTEWDVFLSYSSKDRSALPAVVRRLGEEGLHTYVDAIADADLDPTRVDVVTAQRLRTRLSYSRALLVLTSSKARLSRWVPWELGFADGAGKPVALLPFVDDSERHLAYVGNEYLALYPYVDEANDMSGISQLWVNDDADASLYVRLISWVDGQPMEGSGD